MKHKLLNKLWLRVGMIVAIMTTALAGTAWAETAIYSVTSTSVVSSSGIVPTGSSATYNSTYTTKFQLTAGNSATLALSGYEGCRITNITLKMRSNSSGGAGTLAYSTDGGSNYTYIIGTSSTGVNFNDERWYNSWTTSYVDVSKDVDITATSSDLKIVIAATANSLYCSSYTITYTPDGSTGESGKATLTQSNLELTSSYTTDTEMTIDGITYVYTDLMKNNENIQAKANTGTIKNTTAYPGDITSVAITHYDTERATTINGSADGTNWTQVATGSGSIIADFSGKGYKYFQITRGSNAAYWTKIEITYSIVSYTIAAAANNASWGTVSLSGNVITASPNEGYRYASPAYSVNPANSATVVQNDNVFTVTPSDNTTVTINFEAIPTHTATFSVNGTTSTQTVAEGAAIAFPTNPDDIDGKTFVGWVTNTISGTTNEAPTFVTTATMGTVDVTYYAVFADENTSENTSINSITISQTDFTSALTNSYGNRTITKSINSTNYTIELNACKQNSMCQMRDNTILSYIYFPELPGQITNISTTKCTNASGANYEGTIHIKTSKTRGNSDTDDITKLVASSPGISSFNIELSGNDRSFYLLTSAGLRIKDLTVTYSVTESITTYSNYCTTVAPPASITLGSYAIEVDAAEHESTLTLAYENLEITDMTDFGIQFYDAEGAALTGDNEPDWIVALVAEAEGGEGYVVSYLMDENTGAERTAYFKVFAMDSDDFVYSDLVTITQSAIAVTLNTSGYATFASTSAVDFTDAEENGYSAWAVMGVSGTDITFQQITGAVAAGTGVLLKGEASATISPVYVASGDAVSGNKLVGITTATHIEADQYYGLSGREFKKVKAGTVPAGKALLPASVVNGSGVKTLNFVFEDDATAIKTIDNGQLTTEGVIYNVAGQRMSKMQKGINIVNGKKILK